MEDPNIGYENFLLYLINEKRNPRLANLSHNKLLTESCKYGYCDIIKVILDNIKTANADAAFIVACRFNKLEVIELLIDNYLIDKSLLEKALYMTIEFKKKDLMILLINKGVRIEYGSKYYTKPRNYYQVD